jgi:uncharacterized membrane protein HdeD (DUF308 family)
MTDIGAAATPGSRARGRRREAARFWWIYLVLGAAWLLFAIIIFRFDWTSVSSISILFGAAMLAAGGAEFFAVAGASGGWKIAHVLLGLALIVIGVVAFVHPGDTFSALAGVMSFYFIVKGIFDLALSLANVRAPLWWLRLLVGMAEIILGFWAAGDFGHKTVLLLVWVGAAALTRGIMDIVAAFALRGYADADAG